MEIKANFLLIGLFTLLGMGAVLGAFLWLGAVRLDRETAVYGVLFTDVSGLTVNGEVVYNGLPVGRVTDLRLYEQDPSLIYTRIEVEAETPIREDTMAQLSSQGVTGVAYVSLTGSTSNAPRLVTDNAAPPLIPSQQTGFQALLTDAPEMIADAAALIADLRGFVQPETRDKVARILTNLDAASGKLDETLDGMAGLTEGLASAATQIGGLGDTISALEGQVRDTLTNADAALIAAAEAFEAATPALEEAREVVDLTKTLLAEDAPQTLDAWRSGVGRLDAALASAETAFASLEQTSDRIEALASGDGTALLSSARAAMDAAAPALRDDLPAALADLRAAGTETRAALGRITEDIAGATDQLDPLATETRAAIASATELLDRAGPSLDRLDSALAAADSALTSAADTLRADIGPAMSDIRAAAAAVARDLPTLTARAESVLVDIGGAVAAVTPGLRTFGTSTLPEYGRLATDARSLIRNLSDVVRRIEQNPAGFIQGSQVPEYRR
ncbi:phospholipid/cholesterol/gamma-HCH transport system substrate-binding protein [Jannaschia faecimaris]|uniref:Phospholipid/cholesterol/gamma-HCH transport system substrate-binding protein n=1 Tax=Jannaschia faecimaris TaxID=1244108 RepID=A0A1H3STJ7_9RHOB|nr:MlaD family protein [Jannaschia faecimaris]SDZ40449.1 phospholipid/cholesterol/gamma-HCH transport system substrate-binding protein [Jannaschia faecimaris]